MAVAIFSNPISSPVPSAVPVSVKLFVGSISSTGTPDSPSTVKDAASTLVVADTAASDGSTPVLWEYAWVIGIDVTVDVVDAGGGGVCSGAAAAAEDWIKRRVLRWI